METIYNEELPVLERIKIPMVWERLSCGVCVKDLQPDKYQEALEIIKVHFLEDDALCKASGVNNSEEAVEEYLKVALLWMKDTQSFLAIEDGTDRTVGVLIGRVNERDAQTHAMNRTRIYESNPMKIIQRFLSQIHKQVDLFDLYQVEAIYEVCIWCVVCDFRGKGVGKALLRTGLEQTKQFRLSATMGVFTGTVSQIIAGDMGFLSHYEILYKEWKDGDNPVFESAGPGNNSAILMAKNVISDNRISLL